eukprot:Pgem_evm1s890
MKLFVTVTALSLQCHSMSVDTTDCIESKYIEQCGHSVDVCKEERPEITQFNPSCINGGLGCNFLHKCCQLYKNGVYAPNPAINQRVCGYDQAPPSGDIGASPVSKQCKDHIQWVLDNIAQYTRFNVEHTQSSAQQYLHDCEQNIVDCPESTNYTGPEIKCSGQSVQTPIIPKIPSLPVISPSVTEFPADSNQFQIQYMNTFNESITVWIDNQAFCEKHSTSSDCHQGDDEAWNKNLGEFYILRKVGSKWVENKVNSARKQVLQVGEVWRIIPPHENNLPYWCFDQPDGNGGWRRNCPGVGAWVTREGVNMPAIDKVTKFEYNVNGGDLWFDVSAVDGINAKSSAKYTGMNCDNNERTCLIDPETCPNNIQEINGQRTCASAKWWPNIDE